MIRAAAALAGATTLLAASVAGAQGFANHDWFVLQPELSLSYANVVAIDNSGLFPSASSSGGLGEHFGLLAGMRFGPLGFGVRVNYAHYDPFDIGGAGLAVELRLPAPVIQPFGRVSGGYAWLGNLSADPAYLVCGASGTAPNCPKVAGWFAGVGGGLDFAFFRHFTFGAHVDLNFLNLNRSSSPTSVTFMNPGNSVGIQFVAGVHAALRL